MQFVWWIKDKLSIKSPVPLIVTHQSLHTANILSFDSLILIDYIRSRPLLQALLRPKVKGISTPVSVLYCILGKQHSQVIYIWHSHRQIVQSCLQALAWQLAVAGCSRTDAGCSVVMFSRESTTDCRPEVTPPAGLVSSLPVAACA